MTAPTTKFTVSRNKKEIIVHLPIDLLVFCQKHRDEQVVISDEKAMADYLIKRLIDYDEDSESAESSFTKWIDGIYTHAYENAETWLNGWGGLE